MGIDSAPSSVLISSRSWPGARYIPLVVVVTGWPCGPFVTLVLFHVAVRTLLRASATSANARVAPPPGTHHEMTPVKASRTVAATAILVVILIFFILSISVLG